MIRRTQLIQSGVTINDGPTLEQIKVEEEAQKAANHEEVEDVTSVEDVAGGRGEPRGEDIVETSDDAVETPDYEGMTVPELKAILKESGKPVSGRKADLISRILE